MEIERAEGVAAGCNVVLDEERTEVLSEEELKEVEGRDMGGGVEKDKREYTLKIILGLWPSVFRPLTRSLP